MHHRFFTSRAFLALSSLTWRFFTLLQEGAHPPTHPDDLLGLVSSFGAFYMLAPGRCPGEAFSLALSATPPVGCYLTSTFGASCMLAPGSFPGEAIPPPCLVGHAAHWLSCPPGIPPGRSRISYTNVKDTLLWTGFPAVPPVYGRGPHGASHWAWIPK